MPTVTVALRWDGTDTIVTGPEAADNAPSNAEEAATV